MAASASQSLLLGEREERNGHFFNPLTTNFIRLTAGGIYGRRNFTVEKKHYPWSD
jgi:hypothetical protein